MNYLFPATQLTVLFDEGEVSNTNKIVMDTSQPITQQQVVERVRRHLSIVRFFDILKHWASFLPETCKCTCEHMWSFVSQNFTQWEFILIHLLNFRANVMYLVTTTLSITSSYWWRQSLKNQQHFRWVNVKCWIMLTSWLWMFNVMWCKSKPAICSSQIAQSLTTSAL
jgi:hypothetical protein